jgi:N-methylhydantoinase A
MVFVRELDMRYLGQGYELAVPMTKLAHAIDAFHEKHERTYGYASREDAVEVVAARLVAVGEVPKPSVMVSVAPEGRVVEPQRQSIERQVYFAKIGWTDTPIYQREQLETGASIKGPAIIEQYDSATLVAPSWTAVVDELGNLNLVRA